MTYSLTVHAVQACSSKCSQCIGYYYWLLTETCMVEGMLHRPHFYTHTSLASPRVPFPAPQA